MLSPVLRGKATWPYVTLGVEVMAMEKVLTSESIGDEASLSVAISRLLRDMDELRKRMLHDQADIDESRTRTQKMLAEMVAELNPA